MNIDPADAASVQVPIPNERDNVAMWNETRLMHLPIRCQKLPAASPVAYEEFAINQFMPGDLIEIW